VEAVTEAGTALFFSLPIIIVSFLPIFALQAQEGRMFAPLRFAMAAAAMLSATLVPALMARPAFP